MTVFYEGPCALITHKVFQARCPQHRTFAIRDIRNVHLASRPSDRTAPERAQIRAGSAGIAGAAALAAAVGWPVINSAAMPPVAAAGLTATLLLGAATSTLFAACVWVRQARVHEVWAVYQGRMTCLFSTTDARAFGQVKRALIRAMERADDTGAVMRPGSFP